MPIYLDDRACKTDLGGQFQVLGPEEAICSLVLIKSLPHRVYVYIERPLVSFASLWLQFPKACCVSLLLYK